jgi:hypothetical protein
MASMYYEMFEFSSIGEETSFVVTAWDGRDVCGLKVYYCEPGE